VPAWAGADSFCGHFGRSSSRPQTIIERLVRYCGRLASVGAAAALAGFSPAPLSATDRHLSLGVQIAGRHWTRKDDRVGVALLVHGMSADHREYLALGGRGFLLGDGRLRYGGEEIVEAYYRLQLGPYLEISPDVQLLRHPGYNEDRGPAAVLSLRMNARY
jgi:carbohydrate-selective porin OprB